MSLTGQVYRLSALTDALRSLLLCMSDSDPDISHIYANVSKSNIPAPPVILYFSYISPSSSTNNLTAEGAMSQSRISFVACRLMTNKRKIGEHLSEVLFHH